MSPPFIPPRVPLVLAGGLGTRLREAVPGIAKVLAPVGGRPFLAILLHRLWQTGFREVILCVGHAAEEVERAFGPAYRDLGIRYSREATPLGTGGALRQALALTADPWILAMNGDSFVEADYAAFGAAVRAAGAAGGIGLCEVPDPARYGSVELDGRGFVGRFREKEAGGPSRLINAGLYLFPADSLAAFPAGRPLSFEREVLPRFVAAGLLGYRCGDTFIDIGTPESYRQAETLLSSFEGG